MEEKERYELFGEHVIKDNDDNAKCQLLDTYKTYVILNQQYKENQQLKKQVEELKGERLEFYNDDVRQTQVINGVHFDIEQLLVFSEYVEHEKNISADKDKQINQLKQQLHDLPKKIVTDFYDEIRHRAILEDDYCPDHNFERKYGVRKCLLENIKDTILKKYGGENDL